WQRAALGSAGPHTACECACELAARAVAPGTMSARTAKNVSSLRRAIPAPFLSVTPSHRPGFPGPEVCFVNGTTGRKETLLVEPKWRQRCLGLRHIPLTG